MIEAEKYRIVKFPEVKRGCVLSSLFISLHSFEMVCVCVYVSLGLCVCVCMLVYVNHQPVCVFVCVKGV